MPFETISELINHQLLETASTLWDIGTLGTPQTVSRTKERSFGDYQSNIAFRLSRQAKQAPIDVANTLKKALEQSEVVRQVDVAGKGFLNFWLDNSWLSNRLKEQVSDPHHGIPQRGKGQTVVIDYSSPNVAKRMHIGHMRSTIIGHTLDQLHRAAGWHVIADNHIGDWGKQFGMLIVMWNQSHDANNFEKDPIGELERLYVGFSEVSSPELETQARQEVAKLQAGDPENRALWQRFIAESMREFNGVYERLGIHFDEVLGESAYNDMLPSVVQKLLQYEIAVESDGAVIVSFPKKSKPKMLSETVLVIQKSDGAFLYGTTDLATLEYRHSRWSPTKIVYVTDLRQQLHFQQVFYTWRQWCELDPTITGGAALEHVWFGMLKLPEGAMSTRKGNVIRLVDLLDEATRRARSVVDEKSPELDEPTRASIAEAVGISAVRYFDLSQNPQSDVVFDWDKILSLEGNTAPFLMYSYARGRGIQRKGNIIAPTVDGLAIHDEVTRQLVLLCLETPEIILVSLEQAKPNLLCDHLFGLATLFNRFYYANPVLSESNAELRQSRLAVVEGVLRVLKHGFSIIGIRHLERM